MGAVAALDRGEDVAGGADDLVGGVAELAGLDQAGVPEVDLGDGHPHAEQRHDRLGEPRLCLDRVGGSISRAAVTAPGPGCEDGSEASKSKTSPVAGA